MEYTKHLETKDFIFYCNLLESDENKSTKMYDKKMKLISDNYFAFQYLYEILSGQTSEYIIFISDEMQYNRTEILKELQTT